MISAQSRASAQGVTLSPDDLHAFIQEETGGKYGLKDAQDLISSIDTGVTPRNLGRSLVQGAMMNWGDEALGALPESLGGGEGAKQDMRLRQDLFHKAHPAADFSTQLVGGALPWLFAPELRGAAALGTIGRGALAGSAVGAASGAGAADNMKDIVPDALTGAAAGGVAGAVVPAVAGSVRSMFSPASRALARLNHAIESSGGTQAVRDATAALARGGRGSDAMLADVNDQMRSAADFAANNSDDALIPMAQKFRARRADQSDRLLNDVQETLDTQPDAGAQQSALEASRTAWAGGPNGFQGLRDANPDINFMSKKLAAVLDQPKVSKALEDAKTNGLIGAVPDKSNLSFEQLQGVKEDLDDAVTAAFRQGKGNLGNRLGEARDIVRQHLIDNVPGYKQVAAEYAGRMQLERALEAGQEAWNQVDSRGLARQLAAMGPDELNQFRYGMASKLVEKLRSAQTNRDEATGLMNMSKSLEDKLKVVFGNQYTFQRFMDRVQAEAQLSKLGGAFGNSSTVRRLQAAGFDPGEIGLDIAGHAVTRGPAGMLHAAGNMIAHAGRAALARNTARELAPYLMTQGTKNIDALLSSLTVQDPFLGKYTSKVLAPTAARAAGSLFDY